MINRMNPSVKFIAITVSMIAMAFFFNPWTPLVFFSGVVLIQLLFAKVSWKAWSLMMLPFLLGAVGYFWTTLVFGNEDSTLGTALSLSFRVLAFSSLSLLFVFTTKPVDFILSLMQQLKLSPKIAYSILVGYQFLPVLKDEFFQIRQAQKLRGVEVPKSPVKRVLAMRHVLIPMLAGAVRKAERTAFAMEARGFTGEGKRDFYRKITVSRADAAGIGLFLVLLCGSMAAGFL
ncbi:energy-coupling factor transporter transmembrane component T family protein [Jeotgalibacillus haloalkalitolerans]|uniref:Energy-coupling factor transporter transmembrane component T n=1 Tax=Jeotgalibacillus haloalkalitolerans TaxID=3104292 RepID=A0ABU5KHV1_9BACL|nr:energy-coupling factor transporter transmembrane component T [Jeotgalibacillus sp. HH7-29]MDZ5710809.1 energy-coupling factor transporter transmembrane component T [Jeotgalibacillus sp. HH7-29]